MIKKRIIVTGASRGIGRELALKYVRLGNHVVMIARNEDQLIMNTKVVSNSSGKADYIACNIADKDQLHSAIKNAIIMMGGIDIAILNAGISEKNPLADFDANKLRNVFEVNFFSVVNAFDVLIPIMKSQGGIIAGVGSLADARGLPGSVGYSASKIALSHFLETARIELRKHNIRVITIKPGFVRTDMTAKNKYPMPFIMDAGKAADIIIKRINSDNNRIYFPVIPSFLNYLSKVIPSKLMEWILFKWKIVSEHYEKK